MENKTRILLLENDLLIAHEVEDFLRQAGFTDVHVGETAHTLREARLKLEAEASEMPITTKATNH